jgi:hypothetical protein
MAVLTSIENDKSALASTAAWCTGSLDLKDCTCKEKDEQENRNKTAGWYSCCSWRVYSSSYAPSGIFRYKYGALPRPPVKETLPPVVASSMLPWPLLTVAVFVIVTTAGSAAALS